MCILSSSRISFFEISQEFEEHGIEIRPADSPEEALWKYMGDGDRFSSGGGTINVNRFLGSVVRVDKDIHRWTLDRFERVALELHLLQGVKLAAALTA